MALSYQHEFHSGNPADLQKHMALTLLLEAMCKKDKAFTVIDSHASAGRFNLSDERLLKTGEADSGIKKLMQYYGNPSIPMCDGLKKYLELQKPYFDKGMYAGSPEIERLYMRNGDQLHLIEKHPQALSSLNTNMSLPLLTSTGEKKSEIKANIHNSDSWKELISLTPPLVKRGFVLCDPSYEDSSDYTQSTETLMAVHKKWNTAVIALWYPLITRRKNETAQMLSNLEDFGKLGNMPVESCHVEMIFKNPEELTEESGSHLYGSGIYIMNPPWKLKEELEEGSKQICKLLSLE